MKKFLILCMISLLPVYAQSCEPTKVMLTEEERNLLYNGSKWRLIAREGDEARQLLASLCGAYRYWFTPSSYNPIGQDTRACPLALIALQQYENAPYMLNREAELLEEFAKTWRYTSFIGPCKKNTMNKRKS